MCKSLLVTRLTELNQQLTTIVKLQKMEDEYDKNPILYSKICDCPHHILSTGENKKKIPCNINTCKARKRCTCLYQCTKISKCKFFNNIDIINNYLLLFITSFA
ncbi:ELKS/Rab6-interacting/CAST family member 1-like isoform X1 [Vespula squamosa]|uniref:ELKS/Rab6-interacting/CAST family member 1-like isoform X1 n=1 Tax=Vespula squamosa TaxID=30214 RepID=A0ABD2AGU7_VESSQ